MGDEPRAEKLSISSLNRQNDGFIELSIGEDEMLATAVLHPPIGGGAPLSMDYIREFLARSGVVEGILWDELAEAVFNVNTSGRLAKDVVLARGLAAKNEYPEHIVLDPELTRKPVIDPDANRINWYELSSLVLVRKGQKLGSIIPQQEGQYGRTVTGKDLPYGKTDCTHYSPGKNIERLEDCLRSQCEGRLVIEGTKLSVEEVLVIKGDVDFHVGHISFPGDIMIGGSINAGFRVYSGGSINIKDTTDASDIQAKQDILCGLGIVGKTPGMLRAGRNLQAKFIENARVAVRNNMDVAGAIVGSHIYCLGRLEMGDKGRIVGGELSVRDGIRCGSLGGKTNPVTKIHVGIDFTLQQKLEQANTALQILSMKFQRLNSALKLRDDPAVRKLHDETEAKLHSLSRSIADLAVRVNSNPAAVVEVHGLIYPGVSISICQLLLTIEKEMSKARFRLDTGAGKLLIEKI